MFYLLYKQRTEYGLSPNFLNKEIMTPTNSWCPQSTLRIAKCQYLKWKYSTLEHVTFKDAGKIWRKKSSLSSHWNLTYTHPRRNHEKSHVQARFKTTIHVFHSKITAVNSIGTAISIEYSFLNESLIKFR